MNNPTAWAHIGLLWMLKASLFLIRMGFLAFVSIFVFFLFIGADFTAQGGMLWFASTVGLLLWMGWLCVIRFNWWSFGGWLVGVLIWFFVIGPTSHHVYDVDRCLDWGGAWRDGTCVGSELWDEVEARKAAE